MCLQVQNVMSDVYPIWYLVKLQREIMRHVNDVCFEIQPKYVHLGF